MKKFLNLKNILLCVGALCAFIGFFVAFAAGLISSGSLGTEEIVGIVIGAPKSITTMGSLVTEVALEENAGLSVAGNILIFIFGLGACGVGLFLKKPFTKWILVGCAAVILLGAIFVFCLNPAYAAAIGVDDLSDFSLNAGAVFTGIFGILSAGAIGVSAFVEAK